MAHWNDLTWPELKTQVEKTPFVLLPFGAVEEHGPHLPLGTDTFAVEAIAERVSQAAGLLQLPVMPYGQVWSLENFAGSLSVTDDTIVALVQDLSHGLRAAGVKGIVLFTAHFGNRAALKTAGRRLEADAFPAISLCYPGLETIAAKVRVSEQSHPGIMHADELETSVMLAVDEQRVSMDNAVAEYPAFPAYFDHAPVRWDSLSRSGVFGDATVATSDKGEQILAHVVDTAVTIINAWREDVS